MTALTPIKEKFISSWGEMGAKWGVSRTVAEVHAVFYLSSEPLDAEDIAATLSVSRSNISTSLRELEGWGLIHPLHFRGDRKQYYEALKDPWEMFRIILQERKHRQIDPTVSTLRECLEEGTRATPEDAYTQERLRAALQFFEVMIPLCDGLLQISKDSVENLLKLKTKLQGMIPKGHST